MANGNGYGSPYLATCANNGNFLAKIINDYAHRQLPRAVGLNGAQAMVTQGPKFGVQTGLTWLLTVLAGAAKNRKQTNPVTADFILPVGAAVNLNRVAENKDQAVAEVNQGATIVGKIYDIDVPENVSNQAVTVLESIQTDDSTAANPQADTVTIQVKARCGGGARIQSSFWLFEAVDLGNSCNAFFTAKDYGITFQTGAAYTANGQGRVRQSTLSGPAGTGVSITMISIVTDLLYEILAGLDQVIDELFWTDIKAKMGAEFREYKQTILDEVSAGTWQAPTVPTMMPAPMPQHLPGLVLQPTPMANRRVRRTAPISRTGRNGIRTSGISPLPPQQASYPAVKPPQYSFFAPGAMQSYGGFALANQSGGGMHSGLVRGR